MFCKGSRDEYSLAGKNIMVFMSHRRLASHRPPLARGNVSPEYSGRGRQYLSCKRKSKTKSKDWSRAAYPPQRSLRAALGCCPTTAGGAQFCLLCCQPGPVPESLPARPPSLTQGRPCRPPVWLGHPIHTAIRTCHGPHRSISQVPMRGTERHDPPQQKSKTLKPNFALHKCSKDWAPKGAPPESARARTHGNWAARRPTRERQRIARAKTLRAATRHTKETLAPLGEARLQACGSYRGGGAGSPHRMFFSWSSLSAAVPFAQIAAIQQKMVVATASP